MTALVGVTDCPTYWRRLQDASGRLMFDVGANGGTTARMFADKFVQVVAIEPCVESYRVLIDSPPENVIPACHAISDHTGNVELREAGRAISTGQLVSGDCYLGWGDTLGVREVPCMTLDHLAETRGTPTAVKVDVEGHELQVLQGAPNILASYPTWYIEVHSRAFLDPLMELLSGYTVETIRHSLYAPGSDSWQDHFYLVAS